MAITKNDFINALNNPTYIRQPICRISILDWDENVITTITDDIISCDITLNLQSNSRRNATLTLKNNDLRYLPKYRNLIWLQNKIKIETGLQIGNDKWYETRGIFVISEVRTISKFSDLYAELTLVDKYETLTGTIGGILGADYIIPVGSNIESAVRTLFITEANEVKMPIISGVTGTTPYTITHTSEEPISAILEELANILSFNVYFDKFGNPRFESPTNQLTHYSIWDFDTNSINYLGSTHYFKFSELKNTCIVISDNVGGSLYRSVVSDVNPFSSTRVSLIGDRRFEIKDNLIYSQPLNDQRCIYELQKKIILQEEVTMECINNELINEGDIITILDSNNGLIRDRYYVQSVNFSAFDKSNQSISAWKTRAIV